MKWIILSMFILTSFKTERSGCAQLDIVLIGDFSGSVKGREKFIVEAFSTFIDQFELSESTVKIGLIAFDDFAHILSPLTSDKATIQTGFDKMKTNQASGGTEMLVGLSAAFTEIIGKNGRSGIQKIIILVSDGDPDDSDKAGEAEMIKQLTSSSYVMVCSIVITQSSCDREFMKEISNGCYAEADYMSLAFELKNLDICL